MPCSSCSFVNPSGFRFCGQCGTPLAPDERQGGPPEPRAYTPRHLIERVLTSRAALEGERKQVTVLFADVKGSLALAEQVGPEPWHRMLDRFFRILADGVHRFEGTVNQYTGDGMMALFGAPLAHEDHAHRACHSALHIAEQLRALAGDLRSRQGIEFRVRMGLNSGEVVVGSIGDDLRMDYTAQGQVVGLASRMEKLAEPGRIYLTERVERLVRGFFELTPLGLREAAGVSRPVSVYELEGVALARTRLDVVAARSLPSLVGRESALAALEKALAEAAVGRGLVVGLEGAAGVGKSRLCLAFVSRCRRAGSPVYETHCPAHTRSLPFFALRQLLRSLLGLVERTGPEQERAAVRAAAGPVADALPLLFDVLGCGEASRPPPRLDPPERERRLSQALVALVEARARRAPLVVLVDDLHWIDAESEGCLAKLAGSVADLPVLLLVNFRPEHRAAWLAGVERRVGLAPLAREASLALIGRLLGDAPSDEGLAERIHQRSGGNPLFIEELVRSLVESGRLEGEPGAYALVGPVEDLEIPDTVRAVIAARIDRLSERDKGLLQMASVIGREFSTPVLSRVSGLAAGALQAALRSLEAGGLVRREGPYAALHAFHHPLTRDVAYRSLLGERRRELHVGVALALVEIGERLGERASLIAHHFEEAERPRDAARWRQRAAFRVTHIVPRGSRRDHGSH
ncbi:MAG: adenylate/guanylate cyclase domain-containing protein [Myxococcota bacterium]|nr:adenylate/guanylate cyclase domain-containing protein [Myxococcota bacterium]